MCGVGGEAPLGTEAAPARVPLVAVLAQLGAAALLAVLLDAPALAARLLARSEAAGRTAVLAGVLVPRVLADALARARLAIVAPNAVLAGAARVTRGRWVPDQWVWARQVAGVPSG